MIINLRPIHSIGKFFDKLSPEKRREAKALAARAHRMPKIEIEQEVLKLKRASEVTNFLA